MPASAIKTGVHVYRRYRGRKIPTGFKCRYCKVWFASFMLTKAQYCPSCRPLRAVHRAAKHDTKDNKAARQAKRRARKSHINADNLSYTIVGDTHGWNCHICTCDIDTNLVYPDPLSKSFDHVIPLSKGGEHVLANVKLAHLRCNVRKGNKI